LREIRLLRKLKIGVMESEILACCEFGI